LFNSAIYYIFYIPNIHFFMAAKTKGILATLIGVTVLLSACTRPTGEENVALAKCLTEKNAVMYGAYWCPHCDRQKKEFGTAGFEHVNYVECDPRGEDAQPELCISKQIEGYPTWEFADGTRLSGEQSLENLALKTGCEAPAEDGEPVEESDPSA
jgi:thiol-disulfide isomerase/thioredoxin